MVRMKMHPTVIRDFKEEDVLNLSEGVGFLYWLEDEEKEMVREFERENESLVYHVIKTFAKIGVMYSLLYVSKYKEEWKNDRKDIENGEILACVINTELKCKDCGYIGIRPNIGGVIRTW